MMKREEHNIQAGVFEWIEYQQHPAFKNIFAIPNGGSRNEKEGENLRKEGVRAGVWDVFMAYPSRGFHGLFLEHKTGKNELTKDKPIYYKHSHTEVRYIREGQVTWGRRLTDAGYCCKVSRSIPQSVEILKWYLEMR
jgi:hypothetical protein